MKVFAGRPRNRIGYLIEDRALVAKSPIGRDFEKRFPACLHMEVTRICGFGIGNWFIGVQRLSLRDALSPTSPPPEAPPKVRT